MSPYDDINPNFERWDVEDLDGWEPWEPDESFDMHEDGCAYCDSVDVREDPEPFGGKPCCDGCFNELIGGDRDDPPWRCGNAPL